MPRGFGHGVSCSQAPRVPSEILQSVILRNSTLGACSVLAFVGDLRGYDSLYGVVRVLAEGYKIYRICIHVCEYLHRHGL